MSTIVGILEYPLGEDYGLAATRRGTPARAYRRALLTKSHPRPRDYMEQLFAERFPGGRLVDTVPADATEVVLLYPDAIGLGWERIERRLPPNIDVRVLNGRRREFPYDRRAHRALGLRRRIERLMLVEATALVVAALVTPALVVVDVLRGRR